MLKGKSKIEWLKGKSKVELVKMANDSLNEIKEFESLGFAKSSRSLLQYMRNNNCAYVRIFRPGTSPKTGSRCSGSYTSMDFFGPIFGAHRISFLYDSRRKKDFVDFLVDKFLTKNPEPSIGIRNAFSRLLHENGLHWRGCSCKDKD